jgi:hypothetical protein
LIHHLGFQQVVDAIGAVLKLWRAEMTAHVAAGLDEGLMSLTLSNLLYMENPYGCKKCQWRITARPRISAQACGIAPEEAEANRATPQRFMGATKAKKEEEEEKQAGNKKVFRSQLTSGGANGMSAVDAFATARQRSIATAVQVFMPARRSDRGI